MPRAIPTARAPDLGRHSAQLERDAFYCSRPWRRLRAAFLAANPLCMDCLDRDVVTKADTVHHIVERLKDPGRALDWDNLRASCAACHTSHHKRKPKT